MSRAKEYAVVVLDVGSAMAPVLPHAVRALSTLLADKVRTGLPLPASQAPIQVATDSLGRGTT